MKKDLINIIIVFSLITLMLLSGSFFYNKKVIAENIATKIAEEKNLKEKQILADQLKEQLRLKIVSENDKLKKDQLRIQQEEYASLQQQVIYDAQQKAIAIKQAEIATLVQQQADAKLAADKLAQQEALAASQAAQKASRKSKAS
ncbi:MAG: hypothetical protein WC827_01445 [Candidatus Paceibacterota bacterium]|jgi:hypothetical protein